MTSVHNPGKHPALIYVDLKHVLKRNNYLAESVVGALRAQPFLIFLMPWWLMRGAAYFADRIYAVSHPDPTLLPYNASVVSLLEVKKSAGHALYLTGTIPGPQIEAIATHLDILYHPDILNREPGGTGAGLGLEHVPELKTRKSAGTLLLCLRAARLHQWVKNTLVFIPLFLSHQFLQPAKVAGAALAFVAFSLCASSFYLLNDLFDLEADRAHPRKRFRPFASGELSVMAAVWLIAAGLAGVVLCTFYLPVAATELIAVYAVVNFLYSAFLKQFLFLDTVILAFLYTLRILVGGSASHIEVSVWALAFSVFFFEGLALLKRVIELVPIKESGLAGGARRAYTAADLTTVTSFASSALLVSVLITILYINSPDVIKLYRHPQVLWLVSLPLLYWIGRLLTLANRGLLTDDPIVFAFRDRVSYLVGIAVIVCVFFAT